MYKVASDGRQRALHQGRPSDWVSGTEQLSAEDQFQQKKASIHILQSRIPDSVGDERKRLIKELALVQAEMPTLRKLVGKEKLKSDGYETVFTQIAKQLLSPVQYRTLSQATFRELERRKAEPT